MVDASTEPLAADQIRLAVERFGLSANNVTYAVIGDMLQYWAAFPAPAGSGSGAGLGFATVAESVHPEVEVGTRVFGFLPMSDGLVIPAGRVDDTGFTDVSEHVRCWPGTPGGSASCAPDQDACARTDSPMAGSRSSGHKLWSADQSARQAARHRQ